MSAIQMKDLAKIAETSFRAAQMRLADLRRCETALREQLQDLNHALRERALADRSKGDPALAAGADELWLQWIATRQTALNLELAGLQSKKAQQFDVVKRAFGRRQAMRALVSREVAVAKQAQARRDWT